MSERFNLLFNNSNLRGCLLLTNIILWFALFFHAFICFCLLILWLNLCSWSFLFCSCCLCNIFFRIKLILNYNFLSLLAFILFVCCLCLSGWFFSLRFLSDLFSHDDWILSKKELYSLIIIGTKQLTWS